MLNASRKKRNPYAPSSPVSSVIHTGRRYPGRQGYAYFHLRVLSGYLAKRLTGLSLSTACHPYHTRSPERPLWWFYFGNESPAYQVELTRHYPVNALLLIAEQNTECIMGSAFCLIINNDEVKFSVNLDSLSHSGVRVNPEVLMLARNQKHE